MNPSLNKVQKDILIDLARKEQPPGQTTRVDGRCYTGSAKVPHNGGRRRPYGILEGLGLIEVKTTIGPGADTAVLTDAGRVQVARFVGAKAGRR